MPVVRMFFRGELDLNTSRRDLAWFSRHGHEMDAEGWAKPEAHTLGMYVEATEDQGLLILMNNHSQPREFILPPENYGSSFRSVFDSAENVLTYEPKLENPGATVLIPAHGLQVWFANRASI